MWLVISVSWTIYVYFALAYATCSFALIVRISGLTPQFALPSSPPYPTCCTSRVMTVIVSALPFTRIPTLRGSLNRAPSLTFGKFTLGMITSFNALGASLLPLLGSPPGWYWYLALPPVFQGSESSALLMMFSEDEEVGLREKCQPARPKAPDMIVRRI